MKKLSARVVLVLLALCLSRSSSQAWDYEGHRAVNQLALASLPADFPAFALTPEARERIAFLSGEPDRWRNVSDPILRHYNGPDHYIDLEQLDDYGIDRNGLPRFRYVFTAQLALARAAHPEKFAPIDPAKNEDHTRELVGFLPWAIMENFDKLKSEFSYLKTFQEAGGTPEEIANARQDILYTMGTMGHYVGDAAQPLHTTKHFNGWVGANPGGYTTGGRIHSWIDGGYFQKIGGIDLKEVLGFIHPAQLISLAYPREASHDPFAIICDYIMDQNKLVEPLYQMEKAGKLSGEGDSGHEGKAFLYGQLAKGGQMLGNLWYTAWQQAPLDNYLKSTLARRNTATTNAPATR
jgi:hypothetical protein